MSKGGKKFEDGLFLSILSFRALLLLRVVCVFFFPRRVAVLRLKVCVSLFSRTKMCACVMCDCTLSLKINETEQRARSARVFNSVREYNTG